MKNSFFVFVVLVTYSIIMTLAFSSTRDRLIKSQKYPIIETIVKVEKEKLSFNSDTTFLDTTTYHFGNHPGSMTRDTMIRRLSIEVDTIKKFLWK